MKKLLILLLLPTFAFASKTQGTASVNIVEMPKDAVDMQCYLGDYFIFCEYSNGTYQVVPIDKGELLKEYE